MELPDGQGVNIFSSVGKSVMRPSEVRAHHPKENDGND